jgi:hypothetical protein
MLNKAPNILKFDDVDGRHGQSEAKINGRWVPARPVGYLSLGWRIKLAWMVFTGKADAFVWPEGQ